MDVYALLALQETEMEESPNIARSAGTPLDLYLKCASLLDSTLQQHFGSGLHVLTNRKDVLLKRFHELGIRPLDIDEIPMTRSGPTGSSFRLAMHKLDALEFLSKRPPLDRVLFLDTDVVLTQSLPAWFDSLLDSADIGFYEITDQVVPAYGYRAVHKDLCIVSDSQAVLRWYGGEILLATSGLLARLQPYLDLCYRNYCDNWQELQHNGDEVVVSAAIGLLLKEEPTATVDLGQLGLVERFWSILPSANLWRGADRLSAVPLLHLPADKSYLGSRSTRGLQPPHFALRHYRWACVRSPGRIARRLKRRVAGRMKRLRMEGTG